MTLSTQEQAKITNLVFPNFWDIDLEVPLISETQFIWTECPISLMVEEENKKDEVEYNQFENWFIPTLVVNQLKAKYENYKKEWFEFQTIDE